MVNKVWLCEVDRPIIVVGYFYAKEVGYVSFFCDVEADCLDILYCFVYFVLIWSCDYVVASVEDV